MTLSLPPSFVGFERLFDQIDRLQHVKPQQTFPPHNIIKIAPHEYVLELALAGYMRDDLDMTLDGNVLTISTVDGHNPDANMPQKYEYIHKGISNKKFRKMFTLTEHIRVGSAYMEDGLLKVHLLEEVPDANKPLKISID